TLSELLAHEISADGYSRQPVLGRHETSDGDYLYLRCSRPDWRNLTGGSAALLLIADIQRQIPFAVFEVPEVTLTGPDLTTVFADGHVASQMRILTRPDYVRLKTAANLVGASAVDYNPVRTDVT